MVTAEVKPRGPLMEHQTVDFADAHKDQVSGPAKAEPKVHSRDVCVYYGDKQALFDVGLDGVAVERRLHGYAIHVTYAKPGKRRRGLVIGACLPHCRSLAGCRLHLPGKIDIARLVARRVRVGDIRTEDFGAQLA